MRGPPTRCYQILRLQRLLLVYNHDIALFSALFQSLEACHRVPGRVVDGMGRSDGGALRYIMIAFFLFEESQQGYPSRQKAVWTRHEKRRTLLTLSTSSRYLGREVSSISWEKLSGHCRGDSTRCLVR